MSLTSTPATPGTASLPGHVRTLVVGAGFAGLGTAIKLDENGFSDFLVLDKGAGVEECSTASASASPSRTSSGTSRTTCGR